MPEIASLPPMPGKGLPVQQPSINPAKRPATATVPQQTIPSLQEQIQRGQGIPACVQAACAPLPDHGPGEGQSAGLLRSKHDATQALLQAFKAETANAGFKQDILQELRGQFEACAAAGAGAACLDGIPASLLALLEQGLDPEQYALRERVREALTQRLSQVEGASQADAGRLLDPDRPISLREMQAALDPGSGPSGRYDCRNLSHKDGGCFDTPPAEGPRAAQATAAKAGTTWMPVFPIRRADGNVDIVVFNSGQDDDLFKDRMSSLLNAMKREHPGKLAAVRVVHAKLDKGGANHSAVWTVEALRAAEAFVRDAGPGLTADALHHHLQGTAQGWAALSPDGLRQFIAASRAEFIGAIDTWQQATGQSAFMPVPPPSGPDGEDPSTDKVRATDAMLTDPTDPTDPTGATAAGPVARIAPEGQPSATNSN